MCRPGAVSPPVSMVVFLGTSARALQEHLRGYLGLDEGMLSSPKLFSWTSFSVWLFLFGFFLFIALLLLGEDSSCSVFCLKHPSHVSSLSFLMLLRASVGGSPSQGHCRAVGSVPPLHLVPRRAGGCLGLCLHLTNPTKPPLKKSSSGFKRKLRIKPIGIYQDESGFHFHHFYKRL